jgi:hypothetical protein
MEQVDFFVYFNIFELFDRKWVGASVIDNPNITIGIGLIED